MKNNFLTFDEFIFENATPQEKIRNLQLKKAEQTTKIQTAQVKMQGTLDGHKKKMAAIDVELAQLGMQRIDLQIKKAQLQASAPKPKK